MLLIMQMHGCPRNVSWFDATEYAEKLAEASKSAEWNMLLGGSRNKSSQRYSGSNQIDEVAWFLANTESKQLVGRKNLIYLVYMI